MSELVPAARKPRRPKPRRATVRTRLRLPRMRPARPFNQRLNTMMKSSFKGVRNGQMENFNVEEMSPFNAEVTGEWNREPTWREGRANYPFRLNCAFQLSTSTFFGK